MCISCSNGRLEYIEVNKEYKCTQQPQLIQIYKNLFKIIPAMEDRKTTQFDSMCATQLEKHTETRESQTRQLKKFTFYWNNKCIQLNFRVFFSLYALISIPTMKSKLINIGNRQILRFVGIE